MSGFRDEELETLKGFVQEQKEIGLPDALFWPQIEALIARLEAAEALLRRLTNDEGDLTDEDMDIDHELYKAWRKSCGK